MSDIYQNAVLTIAATSSTGDNEGCCARDARHTRALEVDIPEHIKDCRIAVRRPLNHWDVQTVSSMTRHFPLLTRGWAFQERLLSRRVLHICESELVWECREACKCECGGLGRRISPGGAFHHAIKDYQEENQPQDMAQQELYDRIETLGFEQRRTTGLSIHDSDLEWEPPPSYEEVISRSNTDSSTSSDPMLRPQTPDENILAFAAHSNIATYQDITPVNEANIKDCSDLVFHYHNIVEHYSGLKLTRPSDRLPAFSGLCKRMHHLRNNYLAGLWSDSICYDLLWRVETFNLEAEGHGARPEDYRGPTWSWVSIDSGVSYYTDITNFHTQDTLSDELSVHTLSPQPQYTAAGQHADKIEMAVTVPGQNPFGAVTSAILTIEASATTATLRYTYAPYWMDGVGAQDFLHYKLEVASRSESDVPIDVLFDADYLLSAAGTSHVPEDSELTLLLIHPKVCLVLRPAQRAVAPTIVNGAMTWERVGIARISENLVNYYGVDWMYGSEVRRFHVV
jgi:hypothetical protein